MTVGGAAVLGRYVPAAAPDERLPLARVLARRLALLAAGQLALAAAAAAAPRYGAAGATAATLAASAATLLVSARMLQGAVPTRALLGSFAGAAAMLAIGWS